MLFISVYYLFLNKTVKIFLNIILALDHTRQHASASNKGLLHLDSTIGLVSLGLGSVSENRILVICYAFILRVFLWRDSRMQSL